MKTVITNRCSALLAAVLAATTLFTCACSDNSAESETDEERTRRPLITKAPAEDSGNDTLIGDTNTYETWQVTELPETDAATEAATSPVTEKKDEPIEDKDLVADAVNIIKETAPTTADILEPIDKPHKLKIPKITLNSANANAFNNKLFSNFYKSIYDDAVNFKDTSGVVYEISYDYKVYNDCIGIIISYVRMRPNSGIYREYNAFYYDVKNDKEITFDEYLAKCGLSMSSAITKLKATSEYKSYSWEGLNHQSTKGAIFDKSGSIFILEEIGINSNCIFPCSAIL